MSDNTADTQDGVGSNFYPQPAPFTWPSVETRPLLPIYSPSPSILSQHPTPSLPSSPRSPTFSSQFTLSTHLVPACHLRTTRDVPVPEHPPAGALTKADREQNAIELAKKLKEWRVSTEPFGTKKVLWCCLNRYSRKTKGGKGSKSSGVTLFFAHANGFPKEIWEPVIKHILATPSGDLVDEIWCWESVQHGDAMLINGDEISAVYDWVDNTRDILNFFLNYLPSSAWEEDLPVHLPHLPTSEAEHRNVNGFKSRQIITIGHSFGGATSCLAAITVPKLFSALILADPVLPEPLIPITQSAAHTHKLVKGALMRREIWKDRQEALTVFQQSPFFGAWDPEVLQVYVECGLYATQDPSTGEDIVRLKMPGIQEAILFSETHTGLEVWQLMPTLDENVRLRWVLPKPGAPEFGPPGAKQRRAWLRPKNSSNVQMANAGHLIPQESPRDFALDISNFLLQHYSPTKHTILRASL